MKPLRGIRIGIIGTGKMGQALIKGLRARGLSGKRLVVTDADSTVLRQVSRKYQVSAVDTIQSVAASADVVILAVKPQQLPEVTTILDAFVRRRILVVSIAAGITTQWLAKHLAGVALARVMPNLPATLGVGFSAITFGKAVSARERATAKAIFGAVGEVVEVPERFFDAITAVSGSGPAYVFFLIHAWEMAARRLKLPPAVAAKAIRQTLIGSLELLRASSESPEVLISKVASRGGTTEAALKVLSDRRVLQNFCDALKAAARRSKQLSWI